MDVSIKTFNVNMQVKNSGVEFEVSEPNGGGHRGDLVLTKSGLEWCEGRVRRGNGVKVNWNEFIEWMKS